MKMFAMLAVAAGLALAAMAPGPAPAQVILNGQLNGFVIDEVQVEVPAVRKGDDPAAKPAPPEAKVAVPAKKEDEKAEAGPPAGARVKYFKPAEPALPAEPAKPAMSPEVKKFVSEFLPQRYGPAEAAADLAKRKAEVKQIEERRAAARAQMEAQQIKAREPMIRQMTQQLRPVLQAELRMLTEMASPTPEQRRAIAMAGGRAAKEAATRMMVGRQVIVDRNGRRVIEQSDPRKMIQAAMAEEVKARLPAEVHDRYRKEMARRDELEKHAVILAQVANLDRLLYLAPDQRDRLVAAMRAYYEAEPCPPIDAMVIYDSHTPYFPDDRILPILTDVQKKVWGDASKINVGTISFRNLGAMNGMGNAPAEDPDVAAAFAEEEQK
ncbi:hypothetical protein TA3x_001632 [Tundrisphaera sp. TA3]|uniref:hypothetical protein n=1 Tax=Tundrisphaera sp. TA3 TaxID=3435775 RepID=UPI003EBEDA8D